MFRDYLEGQEQQAAKSVTIKVFLIKLYKAVCIVTNAYKTCHSNHWLEDYLN